MAFLVAITFDCFVHTNTQQLQNFNSVDCQAACREENVVHNGWIYDSTDVKSRRNCLNTCSGVASKVTMNLLSTIHGVLQVYIAKNVDPKVNYLASMMNEKQNFLTSLLNEKEKYFITLVNKNKNDLSSLMKEKENYLTSLLIAEFLFVCGLIYLVLQNIKHDTAKDVREMVLNKVYDQMQALSTENKELQAVVTSLKIEIEKTKNQLEMDIANLKEEVEDQKIKFEEQRVLMEEQREEVINEIRSPSNVQPTWDLVDVQSDIVTS